LSEVHLTVDVGHSQDRESTRRERDWTGQRVAVLGLARQGKALARYLAERGADVIVSDRKAAKELVEERQELADLSVEFEFGGHTTELLSNTDLLCLSGGVPVDLPIVQQALEQGIPLSNDSQLFVEASQAPIIGITGSAGKTTTTSLVGRMAAAYFEGTERRAWVGGNIGQPLIVDLPRIRPNDLVVMELSSFQLELMTQSPDIAALLNLTPNHLDRHKTMETYTAAKTRILEFQDQAGTTILGRDDAGSWSLRSKVQGRLFTFGLSEFEVGEGTYVAKNAVRLRVNKEDIEVFTLETIELRGEHNLLNVLAACSIAAAAGISLSAMTAGVRGFRGVPHRLEFVRRVHGVDWYNDSIATAPERAIASIRSFDEPLVLLAGGRDKDLAWDEFAALVCDRVTHLILFGEAAEKISVAIANQITTGCDLSLQIVPKLEQAVMAAAKVANEGDVALLAPGGTSFDEFKNFEERGEHFRKWVERL
jgi:UDP-N-acetylmuramoylalanine--D-glutamate ligase